MLKTFGEDFEYGTRRVLQAIDDAAELGVTMTWYQTIYKILGVMKLTRNAIWGLLYQDFGHAPTYKTIDLCRLYAGKKNYQYQQDKRCCSVR